MKIGIDISPVIYETGVSYYFRNLVDALLHLNEENEYVLFGGSLRRLSELKKVVQYYRTTVRGSNVTERVFPIPPTLADLMWNRMHILPIEMFIGDIDVFHSSDWTQPPTNAFKVTTIHDLVPLRFSEISHPRIVRVHKARLRWVQKEADKVIAVSQFTKKEIIDLLEIEPERIVVIPEAPDELFKSAKKQEVEKIKARYKIRGDYILMVGADPRKNIPAVVQAFGFLRKEAGLNLVIVGRPWEKVPQVPGVKLLGHVPRTDLPALYSGAKTLVYTSLYEGFGLPILEAMQAGCPVITSNISSMPEVAGDAAVLVDPTNPKGIADGIEKALSDREKWIKKGKRRVKQFSWRKTAEATLKVYREAG